MSKINNQKSIYIIQYRISQQKPIFEIFWDCIVLLSQL